MDLNLSKSVMDLMFWGRLFHNIGAIFSKALSPKCLGFHTYFREDFFFFFFFYCERRLRLG